MGITKSPGYQFHKEIDQPENEKALGPISKPLATVVGFRLLLIWAFWSISTGWIGHKWPENIGRPRGKVRVCGRHLRPSVGGHITLESITQKIMRVMWWVYRELSRQGPGATVGHRLLCWIDFHTMWFSPAPSRTTQLISSEFWSQGFTVDVPILAPVVINLPLFSLTLRCPVFWCLSSIRAFTHVCEIENRRRH